MISTRYATPVCVLVGLALVPTLIHSYGGVVVDDSRRAARIPTTLAAFSSEPADRNPNWGRRHFESDDWIERRYTAAQGSGVLTVVRSYDLKRLYHHPEIEIVEGADFERSRTLTVDARPEVPLVVLETGLERGPVVFYALHYGDGFVSDPIRFQLRIAAELLFYGRRAMTLFMVQDANVDADADLSQRPAVALLYSAIDAFLAETAPPTHGQTP